MELFLICAEGGGSEGMVDAWNGTRERRAVTRAAMKTRKREHT